MSTAELDILITSLICSPHISDTNTPLLKMMIKTVSVIRWEGIALNNREEIVLLQMASPSLLSGLQWH